MKTLFTAFVLILSTQLSYSQTVTYDTCAHLSNYVGEWMYASGQDTIRVYLRKNRIDDTTHIYDNLVGWHEYKQGGQVIMSDYSNRFMNLSPSFNTMYTSSSISLKLYKCDPSTYRLIGTIDDYLQAREPKMIEATINSSGTAMTWKLRDREGYGYGTGATGHTLPREFTLIKQ